MLKPISSSHLFVSVFAAEVSWSAASFSVRNVRTVVAIATFVVNDEQHDAQEKAD